MQPALDVDDVRIRHESDRMYRKEIGRPMKRILVSGPNFVRRMQLGAAVKTFAVVHPLIEKGNAGLGEALRECECPHLKIRLPNGTSDNGIRSTQRLVQRLASH